MISLDFELYWGVRDLQTLEAYGANIRGVHSVLPRLLDLFEEMGVRATFATVGLLFCRDLDELRKALPTRRPGYHDPNLSPYGAVEELRDADPHYFAGDLLDRLSAHEIASHTFSHYYCLAPGQSAEELEADLRAARALAERRGVELRSLVFPRNQLNTAYLDVIARNGFRCYRGNERSWLNRPESSAVSGRLIRAFRLIDSYLDLTGSNAHELVGGAAPVDIPASRFLRPYTPRLRWLEPLRLRRIQRGLDQAARTGRLYHLWWHPHNFGVHQEANLAFLRQVLQRYRELADRGLLENPTMGELSERLCAND